MSEPDAPGRARSHVKMDRWALFDVAREYQLSAAEFCLLVALVLLVDHQRDSFSWTGTLADLADRTHVSRNTVASALRRLCDHDLVVEVVPFRRSARGTVALPAYYAVLVVPEHKRRADFAQDSAKDGQELRARFAQTSRSLRAVIAQNDAKSPGLTSGFVGREERGSEESEERDESHATRVAVEAVEPLADEEALCEGRDGCDADSVTSAQAEDNLRRGMGELIHREDLPYLRLLKSGKAPPMRPWGEKPVRVEPVADSGAGNRPRP